MFVAIVRGDGGGKVCSEKDLTAEKRKSTETIMRIKYIKQEQSKRN